MSRITINSKQWEHTLGDKGQDVYIALFHDNCENKIQKFLDDNDYDILVEDDADFYSPPVGNVAGESSSTTEENLIFKFRKNVFTEEEQLGAYEGLVEGATESNNRGSASGPRDDEKQGRDFVTDVQVEIMDSYIKGVGSSLFENDIVETIKNKYSKDPLKISLGKVWVRYKIEAMGEEYDNFFDNMIIKWKSMPDEERSAHALLVKETCISGTTYANTVLSGIAGYFDRHPRFPYGRVTSYTEKNRSMFEKCFPFMRQLSKGFEEHVPKRFAIQNKAANILDPEFRIAGVDTPFTTITINKNFRTAAHRDAGDLNEGFSNLTVVAKDKEWKGGYLVLPEYRVAINIRPGDLLLVNNHDGIHGNTEMYPPEGKKIEDMERISLVCYFREKMTQLGSFEYEQHRKKYVEQRRLNPEHPEQRIRWNGVSPSMFFLPEWYDYLTIHGSEDMVRQYHPEAFEKTSSLEAFL